MSGPCLTDLPDDILLFVFKKCSCYDLTAVSQTCRYLNNLVKDEMLWKYFCMRDYRLRQNQLPKTESFHNLYTTFLYQYGWMQGLYQTEITPYCELMEVRFHSGVLEGVNWVPESADDVEAPLKEYILFSIKAGEDQVEFTCLPEIAPHSCTFTLDKEKGQMYQHCDSPNTHLEAIWDNVINSAKRLQVIFLNEVIRKLLHKPILIPEPYEIPEELRMKDGKFPPQIFTPGIFKGTYGLHGIEVIMFKYKDENEIHGIKITGDSNVYAGKISVKVCLKFPALISSDDQQSFDRLKAIEPSSSNMLLEQSEQVFRVPDGCHLRGVTPPSTCKARYHGFGQVAYESFQDPHFIPAHVMVFNNDLLGVLWLQLASFSLYRRVERNFTRNFLPDLESAV